MDNTSSTWTLQDINKAHEAWKSDLNLPIMAKPAGLGKEHEWPSNINQLTSRQLGDLQLKLTGLYTYVLYLLGKEESDLATFEALYDIKLGLAMHDLVSSYRDSKAPLKEVQRALAIKQDPTLSNMYRSLLTRKKHVRYLADQAKIYSEQLTRLSREQSRREMEIRNAI